jgi:ribosomal protein S18 acetylase RimI-like enzyme
MNGNGKSIKYKRITEGDVTQCRTLCNALMQHQADCGRMHADVLREMNFENRLKPSFENAADKQLIVAYDEAQPIGYVYSTAELATEMIKEIQPTWAASLPQQDAQGLYPSWLPTPSKVGCLNNLYVLPEYRGQGIAKKLCDSAMRWLKSVAEIQYIFVYISNGNEQVIDFYQKYGFIYSHDVFGGFIIAYYQSN